MKEEIRKLPKRREVLWARARIIRSIRRFFTERDYLEVETPCRVPALIPEMYIDAVPSGSWFLHPSPEMCMKRLLAEGYERIFQICKCFREGERGTCHLPEFTMLEWYRRDINYISLMEECRELIVSISHDLGYGADIVYRGNSIGLQEAWEHLSVREAFDRYASLTLEDALRKDCFDEVMVCSIEPNLGRNRPTFLYDYPASPGALAKNKEDNPAVSERFELYMAGIELANAFSELVDIEEQRLRFEKVRECRCSANRAVYPVPEKFLNAFATMPVAAGIALGLDRLTMIFTDSAEIDDVVAFTPENL